MNEKDYSQLLTDASEQVKKAGRILLEQLKSDMIRKKAPKDFVTDIDTTVQETLQQGLRNLAPEIQFMGEEKDNSDLDLSKPTWILDPVDGTLNLIHGFRHSAISLALAVQKEVVLGIVYNPFSDEMFTAVKGEGAFLNGSLIHVSGCMELSEAVCLVGTNPAYRKNSEQVFSRIRRLYENSVDIRRMGSAALDLCYVACGRADCYVEEGLFPWDYAAGILIVKEAGGTVTDLQGEEVRIDSNWGNVTISNGMLHDRLLQLV